MDRIRAALDEVLEKVKTAVKGDPKSPVELLLDVHLPLHDGVVSFSPKNCTAAAIPTFVLTDFASRSNNIVDYPFILGRIWDIMIEAQHEPALLKKALHLLHYLLINGSIQVLKDCQDPVRTEFFCELAAHYNRTEFEQYQFSKHLDVGAGVRKTASEIHHLIVNERELLHARRSAEKLHQSLSERGLRSAYPSPRTDSGSSSSPARACSVASFSFQDESRPPKYTDSLPTGSMWDDGLGAKIITHEGTVLDDLYRTDSHHNSRTSSASSHESNSSSSSRSRHNSRHASNATSSNNSKRQTESQATVSLTTTSADLLGLEELLLTPADAAPVTPAPALPYSLLPSARDAKSRTSSNQKLVATI